MIRATRRPDNDDHATLQPSGGNEARLAVIKAVIFDSDYLASKDGGGIYEIKMPVSKRSSPLYRVGGNGHLTLCNHIIMNVKN